MTRKKTHEEYIAELAIKNPNIIVLEQYNGAHVKILHRCLIDGYEWLASPRNIIAGKGCPMCAGAVKRTHEEYVKELAIKNPTVEVIDEYIDTKTPILHRCLIHDVYWMIRPSHALEGVKCKECQKDLLKKTKK